jgi:hypothetical protein
MSSVSSEARRLCGEKGRKNAILLHDSKFIHAMHKSKSQIKSNESCNRCLWEKMLGISFSPEATFKSMYLFKSGVKKCGVVESIWNRFAAQ